MKSLPLFFLLVTFLFASCQSQQVENERPNVIIIMTDDQGFGDFGVTGNDIIETPAINSFAAESVSFDRLNGKIFPGEPYP